MLARVPVARVFPGAPLELASPWSLLAPGIGALGAPLQQPAEFIRAEARVAKDAGERSLANLLVERDDERVAAIRLLEANVAAALADDAPAVSL